MQYHTVLFDLDGTLTDSGAGITNSVAYALKKLGCSLPEPQVLTRYIGPPLRDSFMRYNGLTEYEAETAVAYYREYFAETGIFENTVYDEIPEVLSRLQQAGYTLAVATSKPEGYAKKILEHFDLARYFAVIAGGTMDKTRANKADIIAYALECLRQTELSRVVMVGDKEHDVYGAQAVGIDVIGVLYGYGDRQELTCAGAVMLAETPEDILRFLPCGS